jgi:hypothetical protein
VNFVTKTQQRRLWEDVAHYLHVNGAWVVSVPLSMEMTVEALPGTLIADQLAKNHVYIGESERCTQGGIQKVLRFALTVREST